MADAVAVEQDERAEQRRLDRVFQEHAWEQLRTYDWWVRRRYNLAPTDPRYLGMTPEQIRVEYWTFILEAKAADAKREGRQIDTLDDLITAQESDEEFDERLAALDRRLAAETAQKTSAVPAAPILTPDPGAAVIAWRRKAPA